MIRDDVMSMTRDLRGKRVLRHDSEEHIGDVKDVVVHPTEGRAIALLVRTPSGARRVIANADWFVDGDVVMARPYSMVGGDVLRRTLARGVLASKHLLGMKVVVDQHNTLGYITDRGKYLGFIRDVYLMPDEPRVAYRVGSAPVNDGTYYLAGSIPSSYSRKEECIEVPRRTASRFAATSPSEAMELAGV